MYDIEKITDPSFIKNLSTKEMQVLCQDIRTFLIDSLSKTGGHVSSNLGVVELTVAMHKVFNSPEDKFIWDVGHQVYIHKILTGRANQFSTLRQYKGLSGFPKRKESVHDCWETGHASTSISAAVGMAYARDLQEKDYHVVAVIGDGSLTGISTKPLRRILNCLRLFGPVSSLWLKNAVSRLPSRTAPCSLVPISGPAVRT